MTKARDILIFLAGAEFFHALSHLILPLFIKLPFTVKIMSYTVNVTSNLNTWAVIGNLVLMFLLLAFAKRSGVK